MSRLSVLWTVQEFPGPAGQSLSLSPAGQSRSSPRAGDARRTGRSRIGRSSAIPADALCRHPHRARPVPGFGQLALAELCTLPGTPRRREGWMGEGAGERALLKEVWRLGSGVERIRQVRPESGTQECPPSVTLLDKGPRTPHTCSQAGKEWCWDPNSLT